MLIRETKDYKDAFISTIADLSSGYKEEYFASILKLFEEEERFEACLGIKEALERFKTLKDVQ
jgi:hypothetical protein